MGAAAAAHHQPTTLTGGLSVGFWHHRRIGPGPEACGRCRERRGMCDPPAFLGDPRECWHWNTPGGTWAVESSD